MENNHGQSEYGKGSRYRPVDRKKYEDGWEQAFNKKSKRDPLAYYSKTRKKWVTLTDRSKE